MSNLIASLWRAQTFAYLTYHFSWFLFGFYPCENLEFVFIYIPCSSSSKTDFILISCCVFDDWRIYGLFLFREVYLSTFGFILHLWTMMFLCMILKGSSLQFQRAQDHRNRSPDEKVLAVFVLLFLSVFRQSDNPTHTWIGISDPDIC